MKKFLLVFVLMGIFVFLTSCTELFQKPSSGEGTTQPSVEDGWKSLEEGKVSEAESIFEDVLSRNPNDPDANAGMAIVKIYRFKEKLYDIAESIQNSLPSFPTYTPLKSSTQLDQSEIDSAIDDLLEIEEYLDRALSDPDISHKLCVNKFDWDGDGTVEAYTPMKVKDANGTIYSIEEVIYSEQLSGTPPYVVIPDGGDAWFDFEGFRAMLREEELPETIAFDDNDYITIDDGTLYLLKFFVKSILTSMRLLATWNLSLPDDFPTNYDDPNWLADVLEYFDENNNMTIDENEWQKLDPFLTFRENGSQNLSGSVNALEEGIEALLEADEDSEKDEGDLHDITSQEYLPEYGLLRDEEEENLRNFLSTLDIKVDVYGDGNTDCTLHFSVLKDNPDNFSDLKVFFPSIQFQNNNGTIVLESIGELPDPTLGGLVEPGIVLPEFVGDILRRGSMLK